MMNYGVRFRSVAFLMSIGFAVSACAAAYRGKIDEFNNPNLTADRYDVLAVLPVDPGGFDANIAARVRDRLLKEGFKIVPALRMVGDGEVTTRDVCDPSRGPTYKGIVFASWDRVVLRDCETIAVAYRAVGGYAGVDQLTRKLVIYLKSTKPK